MKVTRFSPAQRMGTPIANRSMSDLLEELFQDSMSRKPMRDSFNPAVDIIEHETTYELHVNLPGMSKSDIQLQLEDNKLVISGERHFQKEEQSEEGAKPRYHRIESGYGSFKRSFTLSNDIQRDSIQARFENGILLVTLNKKEDGLNKTIEVQ